MYILVYNLHVHVHTCVMYTCTCIYTFALFTGGGYAGLVREREREDIMSDATVTLPSPPVPKPLLSPSITKPLPPPIVTSNTKTSR